MNRAELGSSSVRLCPTTFSCTQQPRARATLRTIACCSLTWIRRTLRFENAFHSRQGRFYAIEAIIQILREKTVLVGHHYQLHGDQEDAGFQQEAVAEALDEKSDDEQNERRDDD